MPARPARATIAAVVLALFLTSCSLVGGGDQAKARKAAQETLNESERTRIENELGRDPRIKKAELGYNNFFGSSGSSSMAVYISPDDRDQVEQIVSLCTRTIWLSKLSPLKTMQVDITWEYPDGAADGITRHSLESTGGSADTLTKLFGERPVPD